MLMRMRCLVRLHQWQKMVTIDGAAYKECRNCPKWKRIVKYKGGPRRKQDHHDPYSELGGESGPAGSV